ncbi:MAG: hypothetical protein RI934_419 [Bacteroidota bacterium]|jgi:choice-of-anchor B domain-containing protein
MNLNFTRISAGFILFLTITGFSETTSAQNANIQFRSNIPYAELSNIWGYVDTTGKEYALVGANNGLSVVNVTNPDQPFKRFFIPGPTSSWREVRTWGKYAYVTTEAGTGVKIVDMSHFPDTIYSKNYTGDGAVAGFIDQIHALHIDNGKLYLYGGNHQSGRAKVFSLSDPWNPHYLGTVSNNYVHDGYVRNDTLYSAQIYNGTLEIIDARNPSAPVVINTQVTPKQFTHNSWMSTNRKVIYTTDEVADAWVTAYDISDYSNIKELDRYQSPASKGSICHNTYVLNNSAVTGHNTDFLLTSYYTDGVTIVDASRPDNLVQVGNYDTSPTYTGGTFNGAWGVYGFLPSGNLLISDIENGLFVLTPTYRRACFLEGTVKDQITQAAIANATITVLNKAELNSITKFNGEFKTGTVDSGTYTIQVSAPGYISKIFNNVVLKNGIVTELPIQLEERLNFNYISYVQLKDSANIKIANAQVILKNAEFNINASTDANGMFSVMPFYAGVYAAYVMKEGYLTAFYDSTLYTPSTGVLAYELEKGFYDDFIGQNNWTVTGNAMRGAWVKGEPIGTVLTGQQIAPEFDASNDFGDECYVTGNGGGAAGTDDIDNGYTTLTSPVLDLSNYISPAIKYQRWFANSGGSGNPNDSLKVFLSNGTVQKLVEVVTATTPKNNSWVEKQILVADYFPNIVNRANMKLSFVTGDDATGHIVEAGVDKVYVIETAKVGFQVNGANVSTMSIYPNPINSNSQIQYQLNELAKEAKIELVDLQGRVLKTFILHADRGALTLDFPIAAGIYLIKLSNGKEQLIQKLIK